MSLLYNNSALSQVEILKKLEEKKINVISSTDSYIKVTCPQCKHDSAYIPLQYNFNTKIICNRKNNCRYTSSLFSYQKNNSESKEKVEEYFSSHGLDKKHLISTGIIGSNLSICLSAKKKAYKQFKTRGTGWIAPKREVWSKKDGDFYPAFHEYNIEDQQLTDTLYVFEGDSDLLKAFQDSITCTAPLFGCSTKPEHENTLAMFSRFENIVFAYDNDIAGRTGASKSALILSKHFPTKNIYMVTLPEENSDYCEYRKTHSVEDFYSLKQTLIDAKKTEQEEKQSKQSDKLKAKLAKSCKINPDDIIEVIKDELQEKEWIITKGGLYCSEQLQHYGQQLEEKFIKKFSNQLVVISDVFCNLSTSEYGVKLMVNGHVVPELIPKTTFMSAYRCLDLANVGVNVSDFNKKYFSEYFSSVLSQKEDKITYSYNGHYGEMFVLGEKGIYKDRIENIRFSGVDCIPHSNGDFDEWKNCINQLQSDTQVSFVMGASAISPLLGLLDIDSFVVHSYGKTSSGKSFGAMVAMSLWGKPKDMTEMWRQTASGSETLFEQSNGVPVLLDDSQQALKDEHIVDTVYTFANQKGKGRAKLSNTGRTMRSKSKTWQGVLLSTGERKITDITCKGGVDARLLEIFRIPPIESHKEGIKVDNIKHKINKHYGFLGEKIIQYGMNNQEELSWLQDHYRDKLSEVVEFNDTLSTRKIPYIVATMIGCHILRKLGLEIASEEDLMSLGLSLGNEISMPVAKKTLEFISDITSANTSKFYKKDADVTFEPEKHGEVWGQINIDDKESCVYFFPSIIKRELEKAGFAFSDLRIMEEDGHILTNNGSHYRKLRIDGKSSSMICVKLYGYDNSETSPTDEEKSNPAWVQYD